MCAAGDVKEEPSKSDTCFEPMQDPASGQTYYVEKNRMALTQKLLSGKNQQITKCVLLLQLRLMNNIKNKKKALGLLVKQKGYVENLLLLKGTKYWISLEGNNISFEPIEGVEPNYRRKNRLLLQYYW